MIWGHLDSHLQKDKIDSMFHTVRENQLQMEQTSQCEKKKKNDTIQILDANLGKLLYSLGVGSL